MKRSAELRALSDDHHRALVLAKQAKTAGTAGDSDEVAAAWQAVRAEYEAGLAPHFAVEEDHLLPAVRRAGGPDLADRVSADHDVLRAHVRDGPFDADTLAAFGQCLFDHVRFEERVVFPFAEEHLSRATLQEIQRLSETDSSA